MSINLHNLAVSADSRSRKKRKRVGRGNASHGSYSGRGIKGQKARTGYSRRPGFEGGRTSLIEKLPKWRGFKSIYPKTQIINLGDLEKISVKDGKVTPVDLYREKIIKSLSQPIKILGKGKLKKKLIITANSFSSLALEKIKKADGEAIIITAKKSPVKKSFEQRKP